MRYQPQAPLTHYLAASLSTYQPEAPFTVAFGTSLLGYQPGAPVSPGTAVRALSYQPGAPYSGALMAKMFAPYIPDAPFSFAVADLALMPAPELVTLTALSAEIVAQQALLENQATSMSAKRMPLLPQLPKQLSDVDISSLDLPPPPRDDLVPASVYKGEFNGDHRQDYLVLWASTKSSAPYADVPPTLYVTLGPGGLGSTDMIDSSDKRMVRRSPTHVLIADFNDDGRDDIFMAPGNDGGAGEPLVLLMSNAEGKYDYVSEEALPEHSAWLNPRWTVWSVAHGDIDADGDLDLLIGTQPHQPLYLAQPTVLRLLVNDGSGTFFDATDALPLAARLPRATPDGVLAHRRLALADFNRDGADDLTLEISTDELATGAVTNTVTKGPTFVTREFVYLNAGFGNFSNSVPLEREQVLSLVAQHYPNQTTEAKQWKANFWTLWNSRKEDGLGPQAFLRPSQL